MRTIFVLYSIYTSHYECTNLTSDKLDYLCGDLKPPHEISLDSKTVVLMVDNKGPW